MVSYTKSHILSRDVLENLILQELDNDRVVVHTPGNAPFSSERAREDDDRDAQLILRVYGLQVLDRYGADFARLNPVFPQSDRRGGFRFKVISRDGHVQQYDLFLIHSPIIPIRLNDPEYRPISD